MFLTLLEGWLVGVAVAAPIGPVGLICIRRTFQIGLKGALIGGFGTAVADAIFATIAALGFAAASAFLLENLFYFKLGGGILLIYLGIREYFAVTPMTETINLTKKTTLSIIASTFFLTISNPLSLISIVALFAAIGRDFAANEVAFVVLGVFWGSMTWWLSIGSLINYTKK